MITILARYHDLHAIYETDTRNGRGNGWAKLDKCLSECLSDNPPSSEPGVSEEKKYNMQERE